MSASVIGKLQSEPAYKLVCTAIENLIYSGELEPGAILPIESELAERFGVNRSTVREGIRLLEQSGLVERRAAKRLAVTRPHLERLATRASRALQLHRVTFSELWETLMALEPATAALAAARASDEEIAQLAANVEAMAKAEGDVARTIALDDEFHDLIDAAAGNRALTLAREPASALIKPAGYLMLPKLKTYRRIVDIHTAILNAIQKRDEADAALQMRRHMVDFRRGYELAGFRADEVLVGR